MIARVATWAERLAPSLRVALTYTPMGEDIGWIGQYCLLRVQALQR